MQERESGNILGERKMHKDVLESPLSRQLSFTPTGRWEN